MRFNITVWLVFCVLSSGISSAQSLGAVARKERERREKNKEQGVTVREFSESEIFEDEVAGEDEEESDEPRDGEAADRDRSSPLPRRPRIDVPIEPDEPEVLEEESRARKRQEAEWRNRFHDARERVARAREQKRILDGVHHVPGMKLVDENGNVIVESLADLRRLVDQANQELRDAEQALRELEEQARRAGIPAGWRR